MHECPIDGCDKKVHRTKLFCRSHWYMVPKPLRDAIWAGYRAGMDKSYWEAVREARRLVNERVPQLDMFTAEGSGPT